MKQTLDDMLKSLFIQARNGAYITPLRYQAAKAVRKYAKEYWVPKDKQPDKYKAGSGIPVPTKDVASVWNGGHNNCRQQMLDNIDKED